jgi:tetratricopeptide (TPR) repeat protein
VIDNHVTGRELDPEIRQELSTLGSGVAGTVARHLVMAGQLIDTDPDLAYRHAMEARRMAGRVAVVREAAGQTAYAAERYSEALAELRAARRINGSVAYLPMMADSERGLGHPDRALELAESPDVSHLDSAGKAEMLIVTAGAYKDLGNLDEALRTLQVRALTSSRQVTWVARLRYAYADLLLGAGRNDEAIEWFTRAAEADLEGETDADERLAELTGLTVVATDDADTGHDDDFLRLPDSTESDR